MNIVLDYDGTLHNSAKIYVPAVRLAYSRLVSRGLAEDRHITEREICRWIGHAAVDVWQSFVPGISPETRDECMAVTGGEMLRLIRNRQAEMYPGAVQSLRELKNSGYNLIFLSNCKRAYMDAHIESFHLKEYFTSFYCGEDYKFIPKHEIFNEIKNTGGFIVVGDRLHDMETARRHGLPFVGCKYGFSEPDELSGADASVDNAYEIAETVRALVISGVNTSVIQPL